ncbi:MgtC/SapB family protein [Neorhizobium sp. NPDC001467]|uniref:MgtC/SapB family protein n=1 Tax=Neorhizobium sp. NPDC001467 TaxID=3390595 RepID=UPI003D07A281
MLQALAEEFSHDGPVPALILLTRMFGAMILCGLIGLERRINKNMAGLRTNMLIGLSVTIFTLVALHFIGSLAPSDDVVRMDPIRLIEAVTGGIAFLAAGVVVFTRGSVQGLTTGASMWLSGAIGLSVGLGLWLIAVLATIAGIIVLWLVRRSETALGIKDDASQE